MQELWTLSKKRKERVGFIIYLQEKISRNRLFCLTLCRFRLTKYKQEMSIHCQQKVSNITKRNWCSFYVLWILCCLSIHPKVRDTVYYIPKVWAVKSKTQAGVFSIEGEQTRKVEVAGTFYPLSLVEGADINEVSLAAVREQIVTLTNERNSLVYQIEALQQEVSSFQRKVKKTRGSCSSRKTRPVSASLLSTNRWKQSLAWRQS